MTSIIIFPAVALACALAVVVFSLARALNELAALQQDLAGLTLLDQETRAGRLMAFALYLFGARRSLKSGNPVLVLRARGQHEDRRFYWLAFPNLRPFFGLTVRPDGSLAWAAGDLQLEDDHEGVVDEKRYPLRGLRWAADHYRALR